VPIVVGDAETAMRVCEAALERGVFAQAIRPPTVPPGTSRLRLAVMATHRASELREAARMLAQAALSCGFRPDAAIPLQTARRRAASRHEDETLFELGVAPAAVAAPPPPVVRVFDGEAPEHTAPLRRAA
jgi:glycine C-acetyltransferase/8-amino-7-oxononanoate synthase